MLTLCKHGTVIGSLAAEYSFTLVFCCVFSGCRPMNNPGDMRMDNGGSSDEESDCGKQPTLACRLHNTLMLCCVVNLYADFISSLCLYKDIRKKQY